MHVRAGSKKPCEHVLTCSLERVDLTPHVVGGVFEFGASLVSEPEHFLQLHRQILAAAVFDQPHDGLLVVPLHTT